MENTTPYLTTLSGTEDALVFSNDSFVSQTSTLPLAFQSLNLAVRVIEGILAVITNGLTITAIVKYEFLRTNMNLLVGFLALADLTGGISPAFLLSHYMLQSNINLWVICCTTEQFINGISSYMNIQTILWISIDRFMYINFPLRYTTLVKRHYVCAAICVTSITAIGYMSILVGLGIDFDDSLVCRSQIIFSAKRLMTISSNSIFLLSSALIIILYSNIAYVACKYTRQIYHEQNMGAGAVSTLSKWENKITKMMAMVLGIYFVCYIPQLVSLMAIRRFTNPPVWMAIIERCGAWVWWMNSWMNPFIYAWKSREFNRVFRLLLGLKSQQTSAA